MSARLILTLLLLCFLPRVSAQPSNPPTSLRPVFSTIPFWPLDGILPADLADKYFVYLDYGAQEYVVSYPAVAGAAQSDGKRIQFRVEAQFAVAPTISVNMSRAPTGLLSYNYTVTNSPSAKRPIRGFGIIAAADDGSITLTHTDWEASLATIPQPSIPGMRDPQGPSLRVRAGAGRLVSWRASSATAIPLSGASSGFQITSRFLPGITSGLASSGITPTLPTQLPAEVEAQLNSVLSPENNWAKVVTIGPKFDSDDGPSRDPVWIASDYRLAIEKLLYGGQLATDSPFIAELNSLLDAVNNGGQRVPFRYRNSPTGDLERQIGTAARLALSSE